MMTYLLNEAFLSKTMIINFCIRCGEPVGTNILGSTYAWWQKTMNRHTHTHTHTYTRDNYRNPHSTCVQRVNYGKKLTCIRIANHTTGRREGGKEGGRERGSEGGRDAVWRREERKEGGWTGE